MTTNWFYELSANGYGIGCTTFDPLSGPRPLQLQSGVRCSPSGPLVPDTQVEYPDMATVQIIWVVMDPQLIGHLKDKPCNFCGPRTF